ncbi:MAG TPA: DNA primase [Acidimicrobiia bacterium]
MGILDEDVVRVRDATDLVALASEHLALKRVGRNFVGLCPFHSEKTPSFNVNPEAGRFRCFGCDASGDAITFVRDVEHLDFVDAVERLASRAGITLRYDDKNVAKDRTRKQRLSEAVAAAIAFYHDLLLVGDDGKNARGYLRSRGFDGDAARQFQLGWSPDDWDRLSLHLQKQKFARDDIEGAGLAFVNKANKLQDQFRGRLMFPIYDQRGDAVGFGGRALGDEQPKYKNSPETPIYQKSRLLYGLNWAKGEVVGRGQVVICEGYTDVMAFALSGSPNAVATCGTALADDHFQILKNLARKVVLAYDSDAAGQNAAEKWYGWEQRYEIQLEVADLPAGKDPADVWHDDPAALLRALERATPFLQFRLDRVLAAADVATLEGRARAAEAGADIVAQHPSDLVRDQYVMKLAGELDIDADRLRDTVARHRKDLASGTARPGTSTRASREEAPPPRRPAVKVDRRELDVLLYAVHEPELVVDWLDERLFVDPLTRGAFEAIAASDSIHDAIASTEDPVRDLLERVAVEEPIASDEPETLRAHLMANTIQPAAQRVLAGMLRAGDDRSTSLKLLLDALAHARESGDWEAVQEDSFELLGWLGEATRGAGRA